MKFGKFFTSFMVVVLMVSVLSVSQTAEAAPEQFVTPTTVFINEIHYDNSGTDVDETIEVAGPAGTDLTGWYLVLYNGSNGLSYDNTNLGGVISDLGSGYGVWVETYPTNGIQNGAPDGVALVDATNTVIQFLSYEGTFTANDGPAVGLLSTDIGVAEGSGTPSGYSLQLTGSGTTYGEFTWAAEAPNTFGAANTGQSFGGGGTPPGMPFPLTEGFDDCTLAGWEIVSVDSDESNTWSCSSTYSNIEANGYGDEAPADEWLITPAFNMDAQENDTLTFRSHTSYTDNNYPQVSVRYSTNYDGGGDPTSATWTELTGITFSPENSSSWTDSGDIDISGISGKNVYFAFQYVSSGTGSGTASRWRLDGIDFFEKVPPPPTADWVINEIHADPASDITGDANGDGVRNATDDEFVEIINNSGGDVDISGWTLSDGFGVRHTFAYGTVLSDQCSIVVFGGGSPAVPFGNSLVQTASSGTLGLNNSGDSVTLNDGSTDVSSSSYGGEGGDNQSLTLDPDITGTAFVKHTLATGSGGTLFSPGTMIDGTPFAECPEYDPLITIGEVQGVVGDSDSGTSHSSPYVGTEVAVQGVVYEKTQEYRSSGGAYYGFFMQNTAAEADGDPNSSDGIFVFLYTYPTLPVWGGGYYEPQIGDELVILATVEERFGNTRLNFANLLEVVRTGVEVDAEIPAFDVNPPASITDDTTFDDTQDANRYWERHEGMRGQIPAGSVVLNGRDVFASTFDSEVWVARPDSLIAQMSDPYERRSFRDIHPLDDIPTVGFDNDNPYRILMGTFGVKAWADDTTALLAPAGTFDTLTNAPVGGVYYNFGKYSIQVDEQIQLSDGADPSQNNPPVAPDRDFEYSVVVFNVENLYDFVDDPFDGCDFQGNSGCPGVSPPFDYAPSSDAVYQARLAEIAQQIISDLHSPDIILAQEAEDQDICTVTAGVYECGTTNNADGKPDTLQELATVIASLGGPTYDAAYDRDGADDRGIVSGYLFRTDRVELLPAMADDPVLGSSPTVVYDHPGADPLPYNYDIQNPKALNAVLPDFVTGSTDGDNVFTRPPQVALFRIWRDGGGASIFQDVYISNNHFSSGPDRRVDQRTEQAAYNAAIVEALQTVNPQVFVGVGGDLNVYPRPDDPFPTPNESDQLSALYEVPMTNLWNIMVSQDPVSAYSYVYQGQAQTLDQFFVSPRWLSELNQARMSHINADFPADYDGDGPRGTSDHDPVFSTYNLLPTLDRLEALVLYYDANGLITGNNTTRILLDRIERARRFHENGKNDAYMSQLQAFIDQVYDFTPRFITQEAADALATEAALLMSLP